MEIRVRGEPQFYDWAEDGSEAAVTWNIKDIRIVPGGDSAMRLVIEGDRAAWHWVWGCTDANLQQQLMEAQFEGKPSDLLEEVRAAFRRYGGGER